MASARWSDNSSDEDGFSIERSNNGSTWSALATVGVNVTRYNNTGLSSNSTWYYRVRAYAGAETSAWSNTANATTFQTPPATPPGMNAVAVSGKRPPSGGLFFSPLFKPFFNSIFNRLLTTVLR